jgi:hypothetical protein
MFDCLDRLSVITIPISIEHIPDHAFSGCKSLRFVEFAFPSQCSLIATGAFQDCRQLKSVFLRSSVEVIYSTFSRSTFEPAQYFVIDIPDFCEEDGCLCEFGYICSVSFHFHRKLFTHESHFRASITRQAFPELCSVQIPKSVRVIGQHCFSDCSQLIHAIERRAFADCSHMAAFTFPSSVSTLGDSGFVGCSELSAVVFEAPSHIMHIPNCLFDKCNRLSCLTIASSTLHSQTSVTVLSCCAWERSFFAMDDHRASEFGEPFVKLERASLLVSTASRS